MGVMGYPEEAKFCFNVHNYIRAHDDRNILGKIKAIKIV